LFYFYIFFFEGRCFLLKICYVECLTESGYQQAQMEGALRLFAGAVQHDVPLVKKDVWAMSRRCEIIRKPTEKRRGTAERRQAPHSRK
jgi:hypothetical protein